MFCHRQELAYKISLYSSSWISVKDIKDNSSLWQSQYAGSHFKSATWSFMVLQCNLSVLVHRPRQMYTLRPQVKCCCKYKAHLRTDFSSLLSRQNKTWLCLDLFFFFKYTHGIELCSLFLAYINPAPWQQTFFLALTTVLWSRWAFASRVM